MKLNCTSRNNEDTKYGICITKSTCHQKKNWKAYEISKGDLVKDLNVNDHNNLVFSLVTDKTNKIIGPEKSFDIIEKVLFKYLHGINDRNERIKFYRNGVRRNFVLNLKKNDVVSVSMPDKEVLAKVFQTKIIDDKILISVGLRDGQLPSEMCNTKLNGTNAKKDYSYSKLVSVSADKIRKPNFSDINEKMQENLKINKSKWVCEVCHNENLKDTNKCKMCNNPKDNNFKLLSQANSSVDTWDSERKQANDSNDYDESYECFGLESVSNNAKNPVPLTKYTLTDENIEDDTSAEGLEKTNSARTVIWPVLYDTLQDKIRASLKNSRSKNNYEIYSEKSKVDNVVEPQLNSVWDCKVCFMSNVNQEQSCTRCDEKNYKEVSAEFNSQTVIDQNLLVSTSSVGTEPLNPFEQDEHGFNNTAINKDGDLMEHCEVPVITNSYLTSCARCESSLVESAGFVLILCQHTICKTCINEQITREELKCIVPINKKICSRPFLLSEIKIILNRDNYERFRTRLIDSNETNSYIKRCYNKNCEGYHLFEKYYVQNPINFPCNKCNLINCLICEVIHDGLTCKQYGKLTDYGKSVDKETVEMFLNWIREGIAMPCPKCEALIEKDEGCDWVKCSFCKTEICWATRGPRWGPGGNGDITGGCGCTKEKLCTELCNYCH